MVNRLAGYLRICPRMGPPVEFKFCNGSTELFGRLMKLEQMDQVHQALSCPQVNGERQLTAAYLKALRLFVYSAALYVCLTERLPICFSEWSAAEWLDEFGEETFLGVIDLPEPNQAQPANSQSGPPLTLKAFKANALARLELLPAAYYDLTPAETVHLLDGVKDRELFQLRQTRLVAILLRNAHFGNPVSEHEFLPLPGDSVADSFRANTPEESFYQLAAAMGAAITAEPMLN